MAYVVGLTGGIGSGKTTVSTLFQKLGVPIIDADVIAHEITQKNMPAHKAIVAHFGNAILNDDQTINRQRLREIIFQNASEKKWLENLLHPIIRTTIEERVSKVKTPYCICVIPLLAESTGYVFLNRILVIDTLLKTQLARVKARDNNSEAFIKKIIGSQASNSARLKIANDVIVNNGDRAALEKEVRALHERYKRLVLTV
ncbi:MAG: dephospho-CoA kinase [Coxiellaceae bacterium]|nr:dephospho-CoA kinase [Coxiellaceae bacterium]